MFILYGAARDGRRRHPRLPRVQKRRNRRATPWAPNNDPQLAPDNNPSLAPKNNPEFAPKNNPQSAPKKTLNQRLKKSQLAPNNDPRA